MASRSELEQVQTVDIAQLNSGEVSESLGDAIVGGIDDEGSLPEHIATVPALSLSTADLLGVGSLVDIIVSSKGSKDLDGSRSLGGGLSVGGHDERALRNLVDVVATGHNKGGDCRGGQTGSNGKAPLGDVHLAVPLPPRLGGGKHAAGATHVAKGGLSGTLGSSSVNTGDTGNGTASSPTHSRGLVTSTHRDGISLTVVLVDVRVHKLNNIRTKGGGHNSREGDLGTLGSISVEHSDQRTCGSHFYKFV